MGDLVGVADLDGAGASCLAPLARRPEESAAPAARAKIAAHRLVVCVVNASPPAIECSDIGLACGDGKY